MADFFGDALANNLTGTALADNMFGDGGNDTLNGGGGNDNLFGDSGNDSLFGGAGQDFLYGGEGNDTLDATGGGPDTLRGGVGNDVYIVDSTIDNLVEGLNQGIDTVRSSVSYTLGANLENLVLTGIGNINGTGNGLNNNITGNSGNNSLSGGAGNDSLSGGAGNDTLTGGAGSDTLAGGAGNDVLIDGGGNDRFLFNTALPAAGVDRIDNLSVGVDKIVLDKTIFAALETVPIAGGAVLLATDFQSTAIIPPALSSAEIVYNPNTGNLFYNANGIAPGFGAGGGQFATLVGSPNNLSRTDFLVVA